MIAQDVSLSYTLAPGWMAPFVDGLKAGKAMARRCGSCEAVSFPPLKICPCGEETRDWIALSGHGDVLYETHGADGDFALVQFDGATTKATVRLIDMQSREPRARLLASEGDLPMLQVTSIKGGS